MDEHDKCHTCNFAINTPTMCRCGYRYCCKDCQMKDKFHKTYCGQAGLFTDFDIKETVYTPDNGVFATKFHKQGTILFTETPMTQNGRIKSKANMKLIMHHLLPRPGTQYTFDDKMRRNAINNEIFFNTAFINNACLPNATFIFHRQHRTLVVRTLKNIQAGEEITVSYLGHLQLKRREVLFNTHGFSCNCACCRNPALSKQLDELSIINNLMRTINYATALKYLNRFISLLDDIEAPAIFYYETYCFMRELAQQANNPAWFFFYDKARECQTNMLEMSIPKEFGVLNKVHLTLT